MPPGNNCGLNILNILLHLTLALLSYALKSNPTFFLPTLQIKWNLMVCAVVFLIFIRQANCFL